MSYFFDLLRHIYQYFSFILIAVNTIYIVIFLYFFIKCFKEITTVKWYIFNCVCISYVLEVGVEFICPWVILEPSLAMIFSNRFFGFLRDTYFFGINAELLLYIVVVAVAEILIIGFFYNIQSDPTVCIVVFLRIF